MKSNDTTKKLAKQLWVHRQIIGIKAKARISNPVLQEGKASQIFQKAINSCPVSGCNSIRFLENLECFVFL